MTDEQTAEAGASAEYPKPMVRVSRGGVNGFDCHLLVVADGDAESAGRDAGYQVIEVPKPEDDPTFQEFPKWLFHQDGSRKVVYSQEEQEKAEGFEDAPIDPEGLERVDVPPPPLADAVAVNPRNMPPRPVDRG